MDHDNKPLPRVEFRRTADGKEFDGASLAEAASVVRALMDTGKSPDGAAAMMLLGLALLVNATTRADADDQAIGRVAESLPAAMRDTVAFIRRMEVGSDHGWHLH